MPRAIELWPSKEICGMLVERALSDDRPGERHYMVNWYTVQIDGVYYDFDVRELAPGDNDTSHTEIIEKAINEDRLKNFLRPSIR